MPKYQKSTDEELREAGFDPQWIMDDDPDQEGPYTLYKSLDELCPCCDGKTFGWLVLDLSRACAMGTTFFGDNGQCDAEETALTLNRAWLLGYDTGHGVVSERENRVK